MSEWVKLTQDKDLKYVNLYLRVEDSHSFTVGKRCDHEINMSLFRQPTTVSTTELANIPWIRTLIQSARQEVQHKEGIHEKATVEYDNENGAIDDAIDNILPAREDDECLDGVIAALKPFAEVAYE